MSHKRASLWCGPRQIESIELLPSGVSVTQSSSPIRIVVFDHERLDVYQQAVRFLALLSGIVEELSRGKAFLADQLQRAALSVVANTAEGAGEFSPREKARFYRMALRSGTECCALLDACRVMAMMEGEGIELARLQLYSVVRMLSKMSQNLGGGKSGKGRG